MLRIANLCAVLLLAAPLSAQEAPLPPPGPSDRPTLDDVPVVMPALQTTWGVRTWLSTGHSTLSYAGVDHVPDIMSELKWTRLQNPMIELSGEAIWYDRLILHLDLGIGTSGTGRLRDQDFDGDGRTDLMSDTVHPADSDNLSYFNLDFGCRLVTWRGFRDPNSCLAIDAFLGWQHWSEKYVARDGTDLFPGDRIFPQGDVIAARQTWDSFRVGLRTQWLFLERGILEARIFYIPYTDFENVDIHYLRTDLLTDPTFVDRARGGTGVMGDVTLSWRIWKCMSVEVGYRAWDICSSGGVSITRAPDGDFFSPFNHASTFRHGALLGLNWRF